MDDDPCVRAGTRSAATCGPVRRLPGAPHCPADPIGRPLAGGPAGCATLASAGPTTERRGDDDDETGFVAHSHEGLRGASRRRWTPTGGGSRRGQPADPLALRLFADGQPAAYTYRAGDGRITVEPGGDDEAGIVVVEPSESCRGVRRPQPPKAGDDLRPAVPGTAARPSVTVRRRRRAGEAALTSTLVRPADLRRRPRRGARPRPGHIVSGSTTTPQRSHAFLQTAEFRRDPQVFDADEILAVRRRGAAMRRAGDPDDKRSWWARNAAGDDVCCRLTYVSQPLRPRRSAARRPRLRRIARSPRSAATAVVLTASDGHTVVIKNFDVVGRALSDLPCTATAWAEGHAVLCPEPGDRHPAGC